MIEKYILNRLPVNATLSCFLFLMLAGCSLFQQNRTVASNILTSSRPRMEIRVASSLSFIRKDLTVGKFKDPNFDRVTQAGETKDTYLFSNRNTDSEKAVTLTINVMEIQNQYLGKRGSDEGDADYYYYRYDFYRHRNDLLQSGETQLSGINVNYGVWAGNETTIVIQIRRRFTPKLCVDIIYTEHFDISQFDNNRDELIRSVEARFHNSAQIQW